MARSTLAFLTLAALAVSAVAAPASPLAFIESDPTLSTFASAIKTANLTSKLSKPDVVLTVFAPTNAAFDAYMKENKIASKQALLADPDLKFLVKQHVVKGDTGISSAKWTQGQALKSWLSETAPIVVSKSDDGKKVTVSSAAGSGPAAKVTKADVAAGAGVVQVVDAVLAAPKNVVEANKAAASLKAAAAAAPAKAAVASVATGGRKMMASA